MIFEKIYNNAVTIKHCLLFCNDNALSLQALLGTIIIILHQQALQAHALLCTVMPHDAMLKMHSNA